MLLRRRLSRCAEASGVASAGNTGIDTGGASSSSNPPAPAGESRAIRKVDGAGVRKLPLPPPAFRAVGAARAGVFEEAPRGAMDVEEEEGPNVLPLR